MKAINGTYFYTAEEVRNGCCRRYQHEDIQVCYVNYVPYGSKNRISSCFEDDISQAMHLCMLMNGELELHLKNC